MSYDGARPADDDYISAGPAVIRENQRAIKEDGIGNAGTLAGKAAGNASGNIPISNGTLCEDLNADKLDGNEASAFAGAAHGHNVATANDDGFMANTMVQKLASIASGAEVNQNAFSNLIVRYAGLFYNLLASSKTDSLQLLDGANITLTPDPVNKTVTISVTGTVPAASYAANAGNASYLQGHSPASFAAATHKYHTGEGYSYNPNGYFRMPDQDGFLSGLIFQWFNTGNLNPGTGAYFNLPVALLNCAWKKAFSGSTSNAVPIFTFPNDSQIFVLNGGAVSGAFYVLVIGQTSI